MKQWYRIFILMLLFALSLICHGQALGVLVHTSHDEVKRTVGFSPIKDESRYQACGGASNDFVIYRAPIQ